MLRAMATARERITRVYETFLRKRPKQSRSERIVDAILTAATDLLHRDEVEQLTVQDVAERAGVGVGSLYDWFSDRGSVLSSVAAKVTEENLERFEATLADKEHAPLEEAVGAIVDLALELYLEQPRMARAVLRIAHATGLMPVLAGSLSVFVASLAAALRARADLALRDADRTAFLLVNLVMGVVHAQLWSAAPMAPALRDTLVAGCLALVRAETGGVTRSAANGA